MINMETGRYRIYTPFTGHQWTDDGYPVVHWEAVKVRTGQGYSRQIIEYQTRQEALDKMNERFKKGEARIRKVPNLQPLTELQQSLLTHLNKIGYDSCYSTLLNSKYTIPWDKMGNFMGGVKNFLPLVRRELVVLEMGIVNPHRGGTRTCTVASLPWVSRYHDRFGNWPPVGLIKEMRGKRDKDI